MPMPAGRVQNQIKRMETVKRAVHAAAPVRRPPGLGGETHGEIHVASSCIRLIRSEELLGDDGELLIDHNGEFYLLSILPGGRLALTGWDGGPLRFIGHRALPR